MSRREDIDIRRAVPKDDPDVLRLLARTLGWPEGGLDEDFFHWKHRANPFGVSPAWVAVDGTRLVGYRTFLRWEFLSDEGRPRRAVRAVDTVTDPDYRGRGIFRSLTLRGVADLTLDRIDFVFNTPNDSSRPGYLSMGWQDSGRVPIGVLPRSPRTLQRMLNARAAAELWSEECDVGVDAAVALNEGDVAVALLRHAHGQGVRTHRTPDYLSWRTSFAPLRYRLLLADDADPSRGGLIFRLRRRGLAMEATVIEALMPDPRHTRKALRRLLSESGADYAIAARTGAGTALLPLPGQGPRLTTRALASAPPQRNAWRLALGDVELF